MGYGGKYGQQYGLDLSGLGFEEFSFRRDEVVTAIDELPAHWLERYRRADEVVTAVDVVFNSPHAYHRISNEVVAASDGVEEIIEDAAAADRATAAPVRLKTYLPVVDLNMIEARLTNRARYYLSRGICDGTLLHPVRYELGSGWENPRWGEPCKPAPDATEVVALVHAGSLFDGQMILEEANASTLVIRCASPETPDFNPTELMVYAEIRHSSRIDENYRQIPFASATFPAWFHTTGQRFLARIVVPLGVGARVETYQRPPSRAQAEEAVAVDTVTVLVSP